MKTCSTAYVGYNFGVVGNTRSEEDHRNKHQNRHEGNKQAQHPIRVEVQKKIAYRISVALNSRSFRLHINHHHNYAQQQQHET